MGFYLQPRKLIRLVFAASFLWYCVKSLSPLFALEDDNVSLRFPVISVLNVVIDTGAADDTTNKYANISIIGYYWTDRGRLVKGNDA